MEPVNDYDAVERDPQVAFVDDLRAFLAGGQGEPDDTQCMLTLRHTAGHQALARAGKCLRVLKDQR